MLPVTGPSNMFTYVLADALVQWLFRKAPAPRLRSWSPHQARTRPAPGPHQARTRPAPGSVSQTMRICKFSGERQRNTPVTCEFEGAHRLSSFSKVHQDLYLSL